jgi:hypothetical protein
MWEDPIVEEVHRTREKLAAEYGYDVKTMFAALRKREASLGVRLVPQKKRAEPTAEADRVCHSGSGGSTSSEAAPAA